MLGGPHHPAPTEPPKTPLRGTATPTPPAFIWVLDESRGGRGGHPSQEPPMQKTEGAKRAGLQRRARKGRRGGRGGESRSTPPSRGKTGEQNLNEPRGDPGTPPHSEHPLLRTGTPLPGERPFMGGTPGAAGGDRGGGSVRPGAAAGGTQRRSAPPPGTQCGGAVPARGAHGRDAPGNGGCMAASGDPSGAEERRNGERERLKARRQRPSRVMCSRGKLYPGLGRAGPGRAGLSPGRSGGGGGGGGGGERAGGRAPPRLPLAPPPPPRSPAPSLAPPPPRSHSPPLPGPAPPANGAPRGAGRRCTERFEVAGKAEGEKVGARAAPGGGGGLKGPRGLKGAASAASFSPPPLNPSSPIQVPPLGGV